MMILALAAPLPAGEDAKISAAEWARVRDISIETIKLSQKPDEITIAYNVAVSIDPNYPVIHKAYMEKMLQAGLVHVALTPALKLMDIVGDDVTALSTVAYMRARNGKLADALAAAVRAAALDGNDPAVLNNLGQLMAWVDADPNAKPDDLVRRDAEAVLKKLRGGDRARHNRLYQPAYDRAKKVYDETNDVTRQYHRKINDAQNAVDGAQAELDRIIKRNGSEKQREDVREVVARKKADLAALRVEERKALENAQRHWRWDPPLLNGQTVRVVEVVPGSKVIPAVGDEEKAAVKLRIAQLFLDNKKPAEAGAVLREILVSYPATTAAAKAKEILAALPK